MNLVDALKHWLNVSMDESEEAELRALETNITDQLILRKKQEETKNAYIFKRKAKEKIEKIKSLGAAATEHDWRQAYKLAQSCDKRMHALLSDKLDAMLMNTCRTILNCSTPIALGFVLLSLFITAIPIDKRPFNIDEVENLWDCILLVPILILPILFKVLSNEGKPFRQLLFFYDNLRGEVLELAKQNIGTSDDCFRNNAEALEQSKSTKKFDENFYCALTRDVMTVPVFSDKNPQRFEKAALLEWLVTKPMNPVTHKPLYPWDLKKDIELRDAINRAVDEELTAMANQGHAEKNSPLVQLSTFSPSSTKPLDNDTKDVPVIHTPRISHTHHYL